MSVLQNPFSTPQSKTSFSFARITWKGLLSRSERVSNVTYITVLLIVVIVGGLVNHFFFTTKASQNDMKQLREVSLLSLEDVRGGDSSIPLIGTVTSVSEATIRSESSGKLTRVNKKLGDRVMAGDIIASFENSLERASVLQAEGVYDQAKAARDIARINTTTTKSSFGEAKTGALNTISNTYSTLDDLIHSKTDVFFTSPRQDTVRFALLIPDAALTYTLENSRKTIEKSLLERERINKTLSTDSDLVAQLNAVQDEAQYVKSYLDNLATAASKGIADSNYSQSVIEGQKVTISLARTSVSNTLSAITLARSALIASQNAEAVANKTTTSENNTVATTDAQVKSALGAYDAALSRLEKTIIRSPISGTINSLSIETGDFVPQFTEVAVVSNNQALEVVTYVTEEDAKRIHVGNTVTIGKDKTGIVTRVAQAIDPRTKKIEVRIGITRGESAAINGESVELIINRSLATQADPSPVTIPLSAIKLTPRGAFIFTMASTSTVGAIPVTIGAILGDTIQILSPLSATTTFILDARGLKDGMEVVVRETPPAENR
jgi:multidrug resistance efflux pump